MYIIRDRWKLTHAAEWRGLTLTRTPIAAALEGTTECRSVACRYPAAPAMENGLGRPANNGIGRAAQGNAS